MNTDVLSCFLVAPFGEKAKQLGGGKIGHFELLRSAIKEIVESFPDAPIALKRADEIVNVGSVQETFIGALYKADVVIADLSATGNANVYYEVGIRFALRRGITIPIWQRGTQLPADLRGVLGVEYDPTDPLSDREKFYQFLRQRRAGQLTDSPVYRVLPTLQIVDAEEIAKLRGRVAELEGDLQQALMTSSMKLIWDEAEGLLAREDLNAALEKLKIAYDRSSRNLDLAVRYGQLLSRGQKHDDAIAVLTSAVRLAEASGGPRHIAYRELGMAYKRAGKAQLAVDQLLKAVAENPKDSDAHGIIGGVYKDSLEIDKAIESYQRGFDADEKSTYCLLNLLCLLRIRNQPGDAVRAKRLLPKADELTTKAVNSEGVDQWAIYDRAHFLLYAKRPKEARQAFLQGLEKTKTIGELESAGRNLHLLKECEVQMGGLSSILQDFAERKSVLVHGSKGS